MTTPPVRQPSAPPAIETPPGMEPAYSNLVRISHSPAELVFDFARLLPGETLAQVVARLLMSPMGAKMLYRALGENLARYETAFGVIPVPNDPSLANELFHPPHPPE